MTLAVLLVYRPWAQPAYGDIPLFQLFGRLIVHGQVPYRDFFDHKTPLTYYANAFIALLAEWFHFDYVLGARGFAVALFSVSGGMFYLLARASGLHRVPSCTAAALFLAVDLFAWTGATGLEPEVLQSLLGIAALFSAYRWRWALSGFLCGLAALAWQPGGVFLFGCASCIFLHERKYALRSLLRLGTAFALPVAVLAVYLAAVGAWGDFWADTVTFNREYVGTPPWPPPFQLAKDFVLIAYNSDRWLFLLGAVGFVTWFVVLPVTLVRRSVLDSLVGQIPIAVTALGVLLYSGINFGGFEDIFPFVPWIVFWAAWLLQPIVIAPPRYGVAIAMACAAVLVGYGQYTLVDQSPLLQNPSETLGWERTQLQRIEDSALLGRNDDVYIVNEAGFALLANRRNLTKYNYLWNGVDAFAIEHHGGPGVLTGPISRREPKLVILASQPGDLLRETTKLGYLEIDPKSLPEALVKHAEFWIRDDLPAVGATAKTLPAMPVPRTQDVCQASDAGPGYSAAVGLAHGWRTFDQFGPYDRLLLAPLSFERGYEATFTAGRSDPTVICSASLFARTDSGARWIVDVKNLPCAGCERLEAPQALGDSALVTAGAGISTIPGGYGVRIVVSRDYLLLSVTAQLPDVSAANQERLTDLAAAVIVRMVSRFYNVGPP